MSSGGAPGAGALPFLPMLALDDSACMCVLGQGGRLCRGCCITPDLHADSSLTILGVVVWRVQSTTEPRVAWLEEQLRNLGLADGPAGTGLMMGSLCAGKFSLDGNW